VYAGVALAASLAAPPVFAQIIFVPPVILTGPAPEDFVEISAGQYHTCARKQNGKTYCWGYNEQGQTGVGETRIWNAALRRYQILPVTRPSFVANTRQVEAGGYHSCAVGTDNRALCWGLNTSGQLGDGSGIDHQPLPVVVAGGLSFNSVSAGLYGSCGQATTGLFCWGNIQNTSTPQQLSANTDFRGVSVGYLHACMLHPLDAFRAYCWGVNSSQQAGVDPALWSGPVPFAFQSSLGQNTLALSTGDYYSCGDRGDGNVWCHGYNGWGQLGTGDFSTGFQARRVGGGGLPLHGVAAGANHACALDNGARAWCWGNGNNGELGQTNPVVSAVPVMVAGGRTLRAVASGTLHSCGIGTDNHVYCWGNNSYGQLGVGSAGGWTATPMQALDPAN
jgi:alpha-tubulin suppressor-like RCC1 family protein